MSPRSIFRRTHLFRFSVPPALNAPVGRFLLAGPARRFLPFVLLRLLRIAVMIADKLL